MTEDDYLQSQYLLIVLEKNDNIQDKSNLSLFFVETMIKELDNINGFFLPQHTYFIDTFDDAKKKIRADNIYSIFNPKADAIQPVIELSSQYNNTIIEFEDVNICNNATENLTGFRKYTICENTKTTIYFKVKSSGIKTNYMIMYYLNDIKDNYLIKLDVNYDKKNVDNNEKLTDILFKFNGISVINSGEISLIFYITGSLYKSDEKYKSTEFTLIFKNIPKENNYIYDLRIQMKARAFVDFFKEEYLSFTVKADLTDIKKSDLKWLTWAIPVIVVGVGLIIALVFLINKFLILRKKNTNLKDEIVSLAFSNDVQKNVLSRESKISRNESDFESTFI